MKHNISTFSQPGFNSISDIYVSSGQLLNDDDHDRQRIFNESQNALSKGTQLFTGKSVSANIYPKGIHLLIKSATPDEFNRLIQIHTVIQTFDKYSYETLKRSIQGALKTHSKEASVQMPEELDVEINSALKKIFNYETRSQKNFFVWILYKLRQFLSKILRRR